MSSKKFIDRARKSFLIKAPYTYRLYQGLCMNMARFIKTSGATEVVVGVKNRVYYEHPAHETTRT